MVSAVGLRNAYDVLYHYVSLGPREQARRYRLWVANADANGDEYRANVILIVSLVGLDDHDFRLTIANIRANVRGGTVLVDADKRRLRQSLDALRKNGVRASPMVPMADLAVGEATGFVFLGRGSCLHRNGLSAITRALDDGADLVYGDADHVDATGERGRPYFKPDFSPDLLLHEDYLSDCVGVSRRHPSVWGNCCKAAMDLTPASR